MTEPVDREERAGDITYKLNAASRYAGELGSRKDADPRDVYSLTMIQTSIHEAHSVIKELRRECDRYREAITKHRAQVLEVEQVAPFDCDDELWEALNDS